MKKFEHLLEQKPIFIEGFKPFDFTEFMGRYAVEIYYTNGNKDVLTTPSTSENVHDKGDLSETEYWELLEELKKL